MQDLYGNDDIEMMYQAELAVPLADKVMTAIKFIQSLENTALNMSPDGYYVCFSGGKDSIVMAKLFEMSGVKYTLNYSNVTIDPPELVQFIKREYPQAVWHSQGVPLPLYMGLHPKGPPTRLNRWCCQVYKEQGGKGRTKAIGVRAAESARRKGAWKMLSVHQSDKTPILCPILYWTDADIWNFIRQNEMQYCCLYDEGFTRLGCVGCPMAGPTGQAREFARWPKYEKLWRRGFDAYWKSWKGVKRRDGGNRWIEQFDNVDQMWIWWRSGKAYEGDQPDCQLYLW